jgi:hypothetical protein
MTKNYMPTLVFTLVALVAAAPLAKSQDAGSSAAQHSQSQSTQPPSAQECHKHSMDMQGRGDDGMGFSQAKTTHHFTMTKDGGVISVDANDEKDTVSRDQIRMHLAHVTKMFGAGDFDIPMFVHEQMPPGVPVMQSKKNQIQYRFEESNMGGRVVITSSDPEAVSAVHDFLGFQIREHKTGDSLTVQ